MKRWAAVLVGAVAVGVLTGLGGYQFIVWAAVQGIEVVADVTVHFIYQGLTW